MTSPLIPWALAIRPTSRSISVDDVDVDLGAFLGAGGPHEGADGLGDAAAAADHLAHVVGGDARPQRQAAAVVLVLDPDAGGVVHDRLGDVGEHGAGGAAVGTVDGVALA